MFEFVLRKVEGNQNNDGNGCGDNKPKRDAPEARERFLNQPIAHVMTRIK